MTFALSEPVQLALIGLAASIVGGIPAVLVAFAALREGRARGVVLNANTTTTNEIKKQTDGILSKVQGELDVSEEKVAGLENVVAHIDERQAK